MLKYKLAALLFLSVIAVSAQEAGNSNFNGKIVGGSVLMATGAHVIGLTIFAENYKPITDSYPKIKKPGIAIGYSLGSAATIGGAILLAVGLNERNVYSDNKNSVSVICTDRVGLCYTF